MIEDFTQKPGVPTTKKFLSKLADSLFGVVPEDPIKQLERAVVRGEGTSKGKPRIYRCINKRRTKDPHHKISDKGKAIFMLPKQDYGKHKTYGTDLTFTETHFLSQEEMYSPEKLKELESFTKNFKLKRSKEETSANSTNRKKYTSDNQVFRTNAGLMIFKKSRRMEGIYDTQKKSLTSDKIELERKKSPKVKLSVSERLYPRDKTSNSKDQVLREKYSKLFSSQEKTRSNKAEYSNTN